MRIEQVGGGVVVFERDEYRNAGVDTVDRALVQGRQHLTERHRHRRAAKGIDLSLLALARQHTDALAGEIRKLGDRRLEDERLGIVHNHADEHETTRIGDLADGLANLGNQDCAPDMGQILEQAGHRQTLEARIGTDEQFRRS